MLQKWERVLKQLKQLDNSLIAYSGGTDSSLLLQAAAVSKIRALAVTARTKVIPKTALAAAEQKAQEIGIPHQFVDFDVFQVPGFSSNTPDRCYHCKKHLIQLLRKVAGENNCRYILDGTNADDAKDYRPGMKAIEEEGVISPLWEAGLTKKEILSLSGEFDLKVMPSDACLASRVPYGENITPAKLEQIELGEALLHRLGFRQCRVRHHGNIARIEVPADEIERLVEQHLRKTILDYFQSLGFIYTAVDMRGYLSGSMNMALKKENL